MHNQSYREYIVFLPSSFAAIALLMCSVVNCLYPFHACSLYSFFPVLIANMYFKYKYNVVTFIINSNFILLYLFSIIC